MFVRTQLILFIYLLQLLETAAFTALIPLSSSSKCSCCGQLKSINEMLPALCLADNDTSCLQSEGSRTLVCDAAALTAAAAARDHAAPCHHYPLTTPPSSPSLVSQRVGAVKVQRCCCDTHTPCRCQARHSPGASVRACIHLRLTTERAHRPTDHTCCLSVRTVRPLCSSHVYRHATDEPDTTE